MTLNSLSYSHKRPQRLVFSAFSSIFLWAFIVSFPFLAKADDFTVENVRVDVTADNAVQAREQAFDAAQIKAYEMLASRMLTQEEMDVFETPPLSKISALVRNFEVTDEKLSAVRYNGTYTIQFRPHALGNRTASSGFSDDKMSDSQGQASILVIPVIERDGRRFIWSRGPYRDAWIQAVATDSGSKIILPVGDADDRGLIRDDEVLNYDYFRLTRLKDKYQAKKALIIVTDPQAAQSRNQNVIISVYEALPTGARFIRQMDVPAYPGEQPQDLFTRVVKQSKIMVENQLSSTQTAQKPPKPKKEAPITGPARSLTAQLNFSSVRDWIDMKRAIEKTRGVSALMIKSMSARNAVVDISYRGDEITLAQNMRQMRVNLQAPQQFAASYGQPPLYTITRIR